MTTGCCGVRYQEARMKALYGDVVYQGARMKA